MKFTISLLLFMLTWFPVCVFGLPATFILLLTSWDGKSTWFGNYLYGRNGNGSDTTSTALPTQPAYPAGT